MRLSSAVFDSNGRQHLQQSVSTTDNSATVSKAPPLLSTKVVPQSPGTSQALKVLGSDETAKPTRFSAVFLPNKNCNSVEFDAGSVRNFNNDLLTEMNKVNVDHQNSGCSSKSLDLFENQAMMNLNNFETSFVPNSDIIDITDDSTDVAYENGGCNSNVVFSPEAGMFGLERMQDAFVLCPDLEKAVVPTAGRGIHSSLSCPSCSYVTHSKQNLNRHLLYHTGARPFGCPYCDYRATTKQNALSHMRRRHDDREISYDHVLTFDT